METSPISDHPGAPVDGSGKSALVILSGGQDSTTCLLGAMHAGYSMVHTISFDYGQRHAIELEAAKRISEVLGVTSHRVVNLTGLLLSSSPLISDTALETYSSFEQMDKTIGDRVELTFVPLRNLLFLVVAANHALAVGCEHLITGVCQMDNANYPDCTYDFLRRARSAIHEALGVNRNGYRGPVLELLAPLLYRSKADTVRLAMMYPQWHEALAESHTCYAGERPPCGKCHACILRAKGFADAGVADPLVERYKGLSAAELKVLEDGYRELRRDVVNRPGLDPYFKLIADVQQRVNDTARRRLLWSTAPREALCQVASEVFGPHNFDFIIAEEAGDPEPRLVITRYSPPK